MAKRELTNLRAILTGASSGIGWYLAKTLSSKSVQLVVTARREDRLNELQSQIIASGGQCEIVVGDITEEATRAKLLETATSVFGGLDILINNAGIGAMGRFDEADPHRLRTVFEVNFFSAVELIRAAIPLLRDGNQPLIVNISSVLGHRAVPLKSEYSASKFAMHGFSDALRAELVEDGIHVQLISPSTIDSDFFDSAIEDSTDKSWKKAGAMPPQRVANIIARVMRTNRHEATLSIGGKSLVWLDRLLPSLADRIIAKYAQ